MHLLYVVEITPTFIAGRDESLRKLLPALSDEEKVRVQRFACSLANAYRLDSKVKPDDQSLSIVSYALSRIGIAAVSGEEPGTVKILRVGGTASHKPKHVGLSARRRLISSVRSLLRRLKESSITCR